MYINVFIYTYMGVCVYTHAHTHVCAYVCVISDGFLVPLLVSVRRLIDIDIDR